MKVKTKICGMRDRQNILDIAVLRPDYLGFIFYPESPRYVGSGFRVPEELPQSILKVGVFVNQATTGIMREASQHSLDLVQLHGHESVAQCKEISREGVRVIKALIVEHPVDLLPGEWYEPYVDFLLLDAQGVRFGGNGRAFNWSILKDWKTHTPFFLAGGIRPGTINGLKDLPMVNFHAVDINSGVESEPGYKDLEKARQLFSELEGMDTLNTTR